MRRAGGIGALTRHAGGGVGALTRRTEGRGIDGARSPHTSPCIHKVVHIQAGAYTRQYTQKAVHTKGGLRNVCSQRRSLVM